MPCVTSQKHRRSNFCRCRLSLSEKLVLNIKHSALSRTTRKKACRIRRIQANCMHGVFMRPTSHIMDGLMIPGHGACRRSYALAVCMKNRLGGARDAKTSPSRLCDDVVSTRYEWNTGAQFYSHGQPVSSSYMYSDCIRKSMISVGCRSCHIIGEMRPRHLWPTRNRGCPIRT